MPALSALKKAHGTITASTITNAETFTIGSKVYTCLDTLTTTNGGVKIGTTDALTVQNLVYAINLSGGVAGTNYATNMTLHPEVSATFDTDTATISAKLPGTEGNFLTITTNSDATVSANLSTGSGNVNTAINEIVAGGQVNADTLTALVQTIQGAANGT